MINWNCCAQAPLWFLLASNSFAGSSNKTPVIEANVSPFRFAVPPDWDRSEFTTNDGRHTDTASLDLNLFGS